MKKLIVIAIVLVLCINVFLFMKLKGLILEKDHGDDVAAEQSEETATEKYANVTDEEKQYFLQETLPYYEQLTLAVDEAWIPYWVEGSKQVETGKISQLEYRLNMQRLELELETVQLKAPNLPIEQLSEPVKAAVEESMRWFEDFLAKRLEATQMLLFSFNSPSLGEKASEKLPEIVEQSDESLIKSSALMYALVHDLQLEDKLQKTQLDISSHNEAEAEPNEEPNPSVATSNAKVTNPALRQYLDDFESLLEHLVESNIDHAYNMRMAYANGTKSLNETIYEINEAYDAINGFFLNEGYVYENLSDYEENLLASLNLELEKVKSAYLDYTNAQKTMTFSLANKRGDMADNLEGYTDADYAEFELQAQNTIEASKLDITAFRKRITDLIGFLEF